MTIGPQELVPAPATAPSAASLFASTPWLWGGFLLLILVLLALDLFIFNRRSRDIKLREAALAGGGWVALAALFGAFVAWKLGPTKAAEFATGYVVELSLSFDNLFVFLVLFRYFQVGPREQHRVLFWGILGALVLRALFIVAGTSLLSRFHWIGWLFGIFLVVTGSKLLWQSDEKHDPETSRVLKLARRLLPVTTTPHGGRFFLVEQGRRCATTLFLCLVTVEASDVVFAVDSIPAIFGVTLDPFVVYTSNVFAILGLRSFFALLALLIDAFKYLNVALALVLIFIGLKMLLAGMMKESLGLEIGTLTSLAIVVGLLGGGVIASLWRRATPGDDAS